MSKEEILKNIKKAEDLKRREAKKREEARKLAEYRKVASKPLTHSPFANLHLLKDEV